MVSHALLERGIRWPVQALLGTALLCGLGPQVIAMEGSLPLSLQSLLVCWLPLMLGWRAGTTAVLFYLAAGILGLPVFADGRSGLDVVAGPTGGYLLGFPIAAFLLGLLGDHWANRSLRLRYVAVAAGMLLGHALILALGIPWQMRFTPDLDPMSLVGHLARPAALKSAIGLLLSVVLLRGVQGRA